MSLEKGIEFRQAMYVPTGQKTEQGLFRVVLRAADGSFNARDLGIVVELSQSAKDEIRRIHESQALAAIAARRRPILLG